MLFIINLMVQKDAEKCKSPGRQSADADSECHPPDI